METLLFGLREVNSKGQVMIAFLDWQVDKEHQQGWLEATNNFLDLESVLSNFQNGVTMKNLMALCYRRAASYSPDAVFSLISMTNESKEHDWKTDYSDSIINCFRDAVENIVGATNSLDIICHSQGVNTWH